MGKLALTNGTRANVWLKVVSILQLDPVLKRTFGPRWSVMSGQPDDAEAMSEPEAPAIALMPRMGPLSWWSPDTFSGPLTILFEVLVDGLDATDVLNIQEAIERAFYPADHAASLAQDQALVALGCETGQAEFTEPLMDDGKAWVSDQQHLRGAVVFTVKRSINN